MCTILIAWRCHPGVPLVLAANRDEFLGRPATAPGVLVDRPRIVGGRDLLAGGTWLAVAADGRVAAVTNRRSELRDPSRRSRGELPLATLAAGDDAGVRRFVEGLDPAAYNPFNLLAVSRTQALVVHGHEPLEVLDLTPGPHVLTVHDVDDAHEPRVEHLRTGLDRAASEAGGPEELLAAMEELLRDPEWSCVHGDLYGTVSSSSVIVRDDGDITYRHAPGRPCDVEHQDRSLLLTQDSR
ncbi:MAG: NRDE family protein [Acidimicrobiia bacterium]|nr:NRDE family protein [Acidimicrobiia bacterium]